MGYSFLDLAYDVLKQAAQPMIYQEIRQVGHDKGLTAKLETTGKTPWQILGAPIYVEVRDNEIGRFTKVGSRPTRFFLRERASEMSVDTISKLEKEEVKKTEKKRHSSIYTDSWWPENDPSPR